MDLVVTALSATVLIVAAVSALAWHLLGRANRLSPAVASPAPVGWLWSPRLAARLHRRMKKSLAAVRACVAVRGDGLGLADVVADLERQACAIDGELVVADRLPHPNRGRVLRELRAEVRHIDALAERTIRTGRAWAGLHPSARDLAPVDERLDALDAALRDLARLDAQSSPVAESVETRIRRSRT